MAIFNDNRSDTPVTTLIGKGTEFKGSINTQGAVRIEGLLEGKIVAQGDVYIGEASIVNADIVGRRVVVAGQVTGAIEAIDGLEISSSGKVYGDVTGLKLIVAEGAIYKGKVNMDIISSKSVNDEAKKQQEKRT